MAPKNVWKFRIHSGGILSYLAALSMVYYMVMGGILEQKTREHVLVVIR